MIIESRCSSGANIKPANIHMYTYQYHSLRSHEPQSYVFLR